MENPQQVGRRLYSVIAGLVPDNKRIVVNAQVASCMQDISEFVTAEKPEPDGGIYDIGTIKGMIIALDPNMTWPDKRILNDEKVEILNLATEGFADDCWMV